MRSSSSTSDAGRGTERRPGLDFGGSILPRTIARRTFTHGSDPSSSADVVVGKACNLTGAPFPQLNGIQVEIVTIRI